MQPPSPPDLSRIEGWIDYYVQKIPEPWIMGGRTGQIRTRFEWGEYMSEREYWRRLFQGEYPGGTKAQGEKRFDQELKLRERKQGFLYHSGVWPKLPRFTKKYVAARFATAPLCEGGCGRKIIRFAYWGEVDPFYTICDKCKKKLKSG